MTFDLHRCVPRSAMVRFTRKQRAVLEELYLRGMVGTSGKQKHLIAEAGRKTGLKTAQIHVSASPN